MNIKDLSRAIILALAVTNIGARAEDCGARLISLPSIEEVRANWMQFYGFGTLFWVTGRIPQWEGVPRLYFPPESAISSIAYVSSGDRDSRVLVVHLKSGTHFKNQRMKWIRLARRTGMTVHTNFSLSSSDPQIANQFLARVQALVLDGTEPLD
ncbi:MAG: hypothetical protein AB7G93_08505 [Bdellovibrionales bacterium]